MSMGIRLENLTKGFGMPPGLLPIPSERFCLFLEEALHLGTEKAFIGEPADKIAYRPREAKGMGNPCETGWLSWFFDLPKAKDTGCGQGKAAEKERPPGNHPPTIPLRKRHMGRTEMMA